ncbi:MAG TPA: hypothetical protein VFR09_03180, partial [Alphaproteobacteria bacterium]|nr:hypothetical protein [Alphaproteobacteria bacterium]
MRFFREHARDPISASLVAAGIFVLLFIGFELARGLHRYHSAYMETSLEKQAPAGLLKATLSLGQMELAGWAPQQTSVQIFDHDKLLVTAPVSIEGKWTASFAFDRHKGVQILNAVDTDKDKTSDMGKIGIFMPEKSGDNAFVWWDGPVIDRLLASPAQGEEGDIALALAWTHGDRGIALAGRAAAGSLVQVYADDEYVGSAP